ncbi:MAG: hypothetical protein RBT38_03630 [Bacteroidales bacterium]|jgi:hypothetical protein|nr:hypothetical protein [Bacteroidales bacterium]
MKDEKYLTAGVILFLMICSLPLQAWAQEERKGRFDVSADLYSNYIWRGSKLGTGPAFQPSVEFTSGGLAIGVWGSVDAGGYSEADPYISYSFPCGLSLGATDYYLPDLSFSETSKADGSHGLELSMGIVRGGFSMNVNYIVNEAGGIGTYGGDKYFEIAYSFTSIRIFAGAGDGWHTGGGGFRVCNAGLEVSKEIVVTDRFSIPVTGQVVLNPDSDKLFILVGISF